MKMLLSIKKDSSNQFSTCDFTILQGLKSMLISDYNALLFNVNK